MVIERFSSSPVEFAFEQKQSAVKGRHLVAKHDLAKGTHVMTSEAYLTSLLSSYRKRICALCYIDNGRRLTEHCPGCDVPYYCSMQCRKRHFMGLPPLATGKQIRMPRTVPSIPHALVCPVLQHMGSTKADADMECILYMLLDILALRQLEENHCSESNKVHLDGKLMSTAGSSVVYNETAAQQPPRADACVAGATVTADLQPQQHGSVIIDSSRIQHSPKICHSEFELLQHHSDSISERDLKDWKLALKHLRAALERAQWQGSIPSEAELLSWVSRIAANSFGLHLDPVAVTLPPSAASQGLGEEVSAPSAQEAAAKLAALQLSQRQLWSADQPSCPREGPPASSEHATVMSPPCEVDSKCSSAISPDPRAGEAPAATPLPTVGALPPEDLFHSREHATSTTSDCGPRRDSPFNESAADDTAVSMEASIAGDCTLTNAPIGREADFCVQSSSAFLSTMARLGSDGRERAVGRELFITGSLFNHSCAPNCIIHRRGAFGFVFAQEDVQAGQELCISYIDLEPPRSSRRSELQKYFRFDCVCSRCQRESAEGSGKSSYRTAAPSKNTAPKRRGRKARISR